MNGYERYNVILKSIDNKNYNNDYNNKIYRELCVFLFYHFFISMTIFYVSQSLVEIIGVYTDDQCMINVSSFILYHSITSTLQYSQSIVMAYNLDSDFTFQLFVQII